MVVLYRVYELVQLLQVLVWLLQVEFMQWVLVFMLKLFSVFLCQVQLVYSEVWLCGVCCRWLFVYWFFFILVLVQLQVLIIFRLLVMLLVVFSFILEIFILFVCEVIGVLFMFCDMLMFFWCRLQIVVVNSELEFIGWYFMLIFYCLFLVGFSELVLFILVLVVGWNDFVQEIQGVMLLLKMQLSVVLLLNFLLWLVLVVLFLLQKVVFVCIQFL